jgi:hypothetical protein
MDGGRFMSFKVLVVPEDHTNNGYILKPLIEAILADAGKPKANVVVLTSPRINGFSQAKAAIKGELQDKYGYYDLWLFIPDADEATPGAMQALEDELAEENIKLLCSPAQPEVEIYACIAHRDQLGASWQTVRDERDMKEKFFDPLIATYGNPRAAGSGRTEFIKASLTPRSALYQLCPELATLRDRIKHLFP